MTANKNIYKLESVAQIQLWSEKSVNFFFFDVLLLNYARLTALLKKNQRNKVMISLVYSANKWGKGEECEGAIACTEGLHVDAVHVSGAQEERHVCFDKA